MSKREQMILLAYKVALATIETHFKKRSNQNNTNYVNKIVKELDDTVRNIETKINAFV